MSRRESVNIYLLYFVARLDEGIEHRSSDHGRRQKIFQGFGGATEKDRKIVLLSLFLGGRQRKKDQKIAKKDRK